MSRYVPVKNSIKNRNLDWINCIVQVHNLQCSCETPLEHTVEEILHQEPNLDYKKPTKCPTGTVDQLTTEEDVFGEGSLEALFAENFGEEEDAPTG